MGYETKLVFVSKSDNKKGGYAEVIGELNLCKCGSENAMGELINLASHRQTISDEDKKKIRHFEDLTKRKYNREENYSNEYDDFSQEEKAEFDKEHDSLYKLIHKKFLYFYLGGEESFIDNYDDLLVVDLKELADALRKAIAKDLLDDIAPYWRFEVALPMVEQFIKNSEGRKIKCILWGY